MKDGVDGHVQKPNRKRTEAGVNFVKPQGFFYCKTELKSFVADCTPVTNRQQGGKSHCMKCCMQQYRQTNARRLD